MFLSSLIKSQKNSSTKINSTFSKTKNYLNPFLKIQVKHVSRSQTSRENREKYDLKKMDDYWDSVDKDVNRRMEIMKQIEEKYKTKSETLVSNSKFSDKEIKEIYFVPLIKSDENILNNYFNKDKHEDIKKGGRLVLLDEVNKFNKNNPFKKISFDYEPLEFQDFEVIKKKYNVLLDNKDYFIVALQQGKKIFEFMENYHLYKNKLHKDMNNNFRTIEHLEAVENTHPLRNNIEVNIEKIESSAWIKNLFKNNKIDDIVLRKKFNELYFDYLDCLNKEAAIRRGYDIEILENSIDKKKLNEIAINQIKEKIDKIDDLLESVVVYDGFEKETNGVYNLTNKLTEQFPEYYEDEEEYEIKVEKENEKTDINKSENDQEFETDDNEVFNNYAFDENKDYTDIFNKSPTEWTFDEIEYVRAYNDYVNQKEIKYLKSSYLGKLLLNLNQAKEELYNLLNEIELNKNNGVYTIKNSIKDSELNKLIEEIKSMTVVANLKDEKDEIYEIENTKEKNLLKSKFQGKTHKEVILRFYEDPKGFLNNMYFNIIQYSKECKEIKISDSVKDKENYILNVLMKFCADVIQSKHKKFSHKDKRLEYFGEKLKSYEIFDKSQNNSDEESFNEEKSNPENYFTPNFKKLTEYLSKKHGLVERSVYDYKNNIENPNYKYPINVMDLTPELSCYDELSLEILRFYLENSDENNLLKKEDEEKVLKVVQECIEIEKETFEIDNEQDENEGMLIYKDIVLF